MKGEGIMENTNPLVGEGPVPKCPACKEHLDMVPIQAVVGQFACIIMACRKCMCPVPVQVMGMAEPPNRIQPASRISLH